MQLTEQALDLIKRWEGLRLDAYQDQAGVWTIGYGHTATARPGMTITEAEAEDLLRDDLMDAEWAVKRGLTNPATPEQYGAFVSLAFNVGGGAFRRSTALRRHNAGDYAGAAEAITWWNKITDPKTGQKVVSQGLVNRREAERALYMSRVAAEDAPASARPTGGEQKPVAKSKTVGLSVSGIIAAFVAAWREVADGAPEVLGLAGSYLPFIALALFTAIAVVRIHEWLTGEH